MATRALVAAIEASDIANRDLLNGNPTKLEQLYAHSPDVTVLGGFGGIESGWEEVGLRLDWAAAQFKSGSYERETLSLVEGSDLAFTVSIERNRVLELGKPNETVLNLRVTQIYRRVDEQWRLVHRHADPLVDKQVP
jgi:ketosteroid isomerase-like protein